MGKAKFTIYYFAGTHWDREWYQPFQSFRYRLVSTMNEVIEVLETHRDIELFTLDGQTILLEDYIEIEPAKRPLVEKLIKEKRLVIGPWYVMPDEFLLSGESLIRNLIFGHKTAEQWGGAAWKYGYICDVFGHIAQMPQIFNGFGIHYALLGRGTNEHTTPAHFIWKSPDGSECITFKIEDKSGYGAFCIDILGRDEDRYTDIKTLYPKIKDYIDHEAERSDIPVVLVMDGLDHEPIHKEIPEYITIIKELYPEAEVYQANLVEMGSELEAFRDRMPVKKGELNETAKNKAPFLHLITYTLSSRYPIKKANDECQALLEKWVEPLTAVADLAGFSIQKSYVDMAYRFLLQNHAHDSICGCSVDQVYKDMEYRFDQCKLISLQLLEEILNYGRSRCQYTGDSQAKAVRLWNPLPFPRKEVVTVDVDFNGGYRTQYQEPFGYEAKNSFRILDSKGNEIPYGLVGIKKNFKVRKYSQYTVSADIHTVSFEAEVPAMGNAEYKIVPFENPSRYLDCMSRAENEAKNEFIKLKINHDGTLKVYDKLSGKSYDNLLSYIDDGEIGDGWFHASPVEDRAAIGPLSGSIVERVENGPSRAVFMVTCFLKVPGFMDYHTHGICRSQEYVTLKIHSLVGLSMGAKYIDIRTTVSNTARDHRLRLKLPTNIQTPVYFVDQPFSFVERRTGIDLKTQNWKECDVPEKQMGGIAGKRAGDGTGLAFVSAYGLHECAALDDDYGTILITLYRSFGKTYLTNGEGGGQILGDLQFKYRLALLSPDTAYADLVRIKDCSQAEIRPVVTTVPEDYKLPYPHSYMEIDGRNVCMSILKRPENSEKNRLVIRLYNMSAEASEAEIRFPGEIKDADEVDMNEDHLQSLSFGRNSLRVEFGPWKIRTLSLLMQEGTMLL